MKWTECVLHVHIWNYYLWACIPNSIVFRLNRKIVVVAMERKTQFALHIAQLSLGNCANGHMVFQVIEWMFHSTSCSRVTTLWMEDTYIQYQTKLPASIETPTLYTDIGCIRFRRIEITLNWSGCVQYCTFNAVVLRPFPVLAFHQTVFCIVIQIHNLLAYTVAHHLNHIDSTIAIIIINSGSTKFLLFKQNSGSNASEAVLWHGMYCKTSTNKWQVHFLVHWELRNLHQFPTADIQIP